MRISSTSSLFAQTQLQRTSKAIAKSLERLSSGKAVNRFGDNAAISSQSTNLDAQVRGLRMGIQNLNAAQGMLTTAESAIGTQMEIITRMREIAVQASNGTLSTTDRSNLNLEVQQLYQEYNRITDNTDFNGTKLLNGSFATTTLQVSTRQGDTIDLAIGSTKPTDIFNRIGGDGTFTQSGTYTGGGSFYTDFNGVGLADINNDNKLDRITSDWGSSQISVAIGNGDGTFRPSRTLSADFQPGQVSVADMDKDGKMDLVVADYALADISIYKGNGDGTFQGRRTITAAQIHNTAINTGDINGDGLPDIIQPNLNGSVSVYLNQGNMTFASAANYTVGSATEAEIADVNNDGKLDIVTGNLSHAYISVLLGIGDGTFASVKTSATSFGGNSAITLGDLNGDGIKDAAVGNYVDSTVHIMIGRGDGTFTETTGITGVPGAYDVRLTDINGDNKLDVLAINTTTYQVMGYYGNGNGGFGSSHALATSEDAFTIGDLNGDGIIDLTSVNLGSIGKTYLGNSQTIDASGEINVLTQAAASSLLTVLDRALTNLNTQQSKLGGLFERLDNATSSNLLRADSLEEARQNMVSSDLALETAELVKNQILQQAQVAVLGQANLQMQVVLQLLKPLTSYDR